MVAVHVVMPFSRPENLGAMLSILRPEGVFWHPVCHDVEHVPAFPSESWIRPWFTQWPADWDPCYAKLNAWIRRHAKSAIDADFYTFMADDDAIQPGLFRRMVEMVAQVAVVSALRGQATPWGVEPRRRYRHPTTTLLASKSNLQIDKVGLGQFAVRGFVLRQMRLFANAHNADGRMAEWLGSRYAVRFYPHEFLLFNALEPGRWDIDVLLKLCPALSGFHQDIHQELHA